MSREQDAAVLSQARDAQRKSEDISQKAISDIAKLGTVMSTVLTVKFRQPSHEFIFGVGMTFISYPLVLTPLV
jgi:hypothetical protein